MTGYFPCGFEFAAEITYPEPEGTSTGFINTAANLFGYIFTIVSSQILASYGDRWANTLMAVVLCIGTILTGLIRSDLRRQAVEKKLDPASCLLKSEIE